MRITERILHRTLGCYKIRIWLDGQADYTLIDAFIKQLVRSYQTRADVQLGSARYYADMIADHFPNTVAAVEVYDPQLDEPGELTYNNWP